MHEEYMANGGTFVSMESDIWFKRAFWSEKDTCHNDCFERLIQDGITETKQ